MLHPTTKVLLHPFEAGLLDPPGATSRILVVNGDDGLVLPAGFPPKPAFVQDFRPLFLALQARGQVVAPQIEDDRYDLALIVAGRHRQLNEWWLDKANERVRPGGLVVFAGMKTDGADSLRKRVQGRFAIEGRAAKHHGGVFWFRADGAAAAPLEPAVVDGRFETLPGVFSYDRIDAGSRLLAANLPADLGGAVADLGAGWGYLAGEIAGSASGLDRIDLYEASHAACRLAEANMARLHPGLPSETFWHDVAAEKPARTYDWAVMNPPFHTGRSGDPEIGRQMIAASRRFLRPRGKLLMVANSHLPYEETLARTFGSWREIVREGGFKVLVTGRG